MQLYQKREQFYDADALLRLQGAGAAILRACRSRLVKIADETRQASLSLVYLRQIYRNYKTEGVRHERLLLSDGQAARAATALAPHLPQPGSSVDLP